MQIYKLQHILSLYFNIWNDISTFVKDMSVYQTQLQCQYQQTTTHRENAH
jgi:hypothetical protein